jgi:4-carboxymuconolactone decarboxylase
MGAMARVEQLTQKAQLAPEWHPLYDRIAAARGQVGGPYSILLHSPGVAERVDALSAALRTETELTPQEHVLTALAVARQKDCLFVWSVQAPNARRAGVSDAAIAAVKARSTDGLNADQADLVSYAQQVVSATRLDQALFDRLRRAHSARWLVEVTTVAGHFALISGINNAFEVPPNAGDDQLEA